jgi:hypothetical protein
VRVVGLAGEQIAGDAEVEYILVIEPPGATAEARAVVLADMTDQTCPIDLAGWACATADAGAEARSAALHGDAGSGRGITKKLTPFARRPARSVGSGSERSERLHGPHWQTFADSGTS